MNGLKWYCAFGTITTGVSFGLGFYYPIVATLGGTAAICTYAGYLYRNCAKTIVRFDYCSSTNSIRMYNITKNNTKYTETSIDNLFVKDEKENLTFFNVARQNGDKFAKHNEKNFKDFIPESNDSLPAIVDAIPHYGSEKFEKTRENTIPIPFYVKNNSGSENQMFLAIGINDFCYLETDLMQKIVEGKFEDAQLIDKRKSLKMEY